MTTLLTWILPGGAIFLYLVRWYLQFQRNIQKAKASGIPYIVLPVIGTNPLWAISYAFWWRVLLQWLPERWVQPWYSYSHPEFSWRLGYDAFSNLATDTFLSVTGAGIFLSTADADVIWQITSRRHDFPKPTEVYKAVNIYGTNVVTADEASWRRHRKLTSPPFSERNNHLVWAESLDQAQNMIHSWLGKDQQRSATVDRLMDDTMRLSLYVISRAGFGRKIAWPQEPDAGGPDGDRGHHGTSKIRNEQQDRDQGHRMSYVYALHSLLQNLHWTFLLPPLLLAKIPVPSIQLAYEAFLEFGQYMSEMVATKRAAMEEGKAMEEMDVIGQLTKGQLLSAQELDAMKDAPLSDTEIKGNAYLFILAGHETVANTLHYSIILLALDWAAQRDLQQDLESHFAGRPVSRWDYDRDLPSLLGGMTGAVMNETLRLCSPVLHVPKSVTRSADQRLVINGQERAVPAGTYINLCSTSVHRNPKWWPVNTAPTTSTTTSLKGASQRQGDSDGKQDANDLDDFKPRRWLVHAANQKDGAGSDFQSEDLGPGETDQGANRAPLAPSPSLYHPPKGAFIPFSEGPRSCLGRRFGSVEAVAVLAAIYSQYSVELAVDKYASDEEIDQMDMDERRQVWNRAAQDAKRLIQESFSIITLQIRTGHVPVRLVPKGQERFNFA